MYIDELVQNWLSLQPKMLAYLISMLLWGDVLSLITQTQKPNHKNCTAGTITQLPIFKSDQIMTFNLCTGYTETTLPHIYQYKTRVHFY